MLKIAQFTHESQYPHEPDPLRILSGAEWALRHGSACVDNGRLKACTDTDYLTFNCPRCGQCLMGGVGIRCEGIQVLDGHPCALSFSIACVACGFRDFFKIAVDNADRYKTGRVTNPRTWRRRDRRRGESAPIRGEIRDINGVNSDHQASHPRHLR